MLWEIKNFDLAVGAMVLILFAALASLALLAAIRWILPYILKFIPNQGAASGSPPPNPWNISNLERAAVISGVISGIVGGVLAVYVAYGTLRIQAMLTARTAINADAGRLLDWERGAEQIRCLYNWYSTYDNGDDCLASIVSSSKNYSEVMLYVEEVYFILNQAKSDDTIWKSGYRDSIQYWIEGVEEDPTGVFRYYLFTLDKEELRPPESIDAANLVLKKSGVKFKQICDGYHRVKACFRAIGQDIVDQTSCETIPPSALTLKRLPQLEAKCRAAHETSQQTVGPTATVSETEPTRA